MEKLVIIGSGPAGLTAAVYAARADLNPVVVEGIKAGGQLTTTTEVENYPGFPQGIQGPELIDRMKKQAERFGARFVQGDVTKADIRGDKKVIELGSRRFETKALIIATGANARYLGLESEQRFIGRGVSGCATCDGFFFRNMDVCVVGGGDTAMEEAAFLTKFANKVTIIHRRDELRASKAMQERARNNSKIEFLYDHVVIEVLGEKNVEGLKVKNVKNSEESRIKCQGLFLGIGHDPATKVFAGQIKMDKNGYIVVKDGTSLTDASGVFACGDVQDSRYRQAITAAGSGCMAALDAERYLSELE